MPRRRNGWRDAGARGAPIKPYDDVAAKLMAELGVAIYGLYASIAPRFAEVVFRPEWAELVSDDTKWLIIMARGRTSGWIAVF